jgi:hypothetical protein
VLAVEGRRGEYLELRGQVQEKILTSKVKLRGSFLSSLFQPTLCAQKAARFNKVSYLNTTMIQCELLQPRVSHQGHPVQTLFLTSLQTTLPSLSMTLTSFKSLYQHIYKSWQAIKPRTPPWFIHDLHMRAMTALWRCLIEVTALSRFTLESATALIDWSINIKILSSFLRSWFLVLLFHILRWSFFFVYSFGCGL